MKFEKKSTPYSRYGKYEFVAEGKNGRFQVYKSPYSWYGWTANYRSKNGTEYIYGFGMHEKPRDAMRSCMNSKYWEKAE